MYSSANINVVAKTCSSPVGAVSSSSRALDILSIRFPSDLAAGALAPHVVLPWRSNTAGSIPTVYCSVLHQFLQGALNIQCSGNLIIEITAYFTSFAST